MIRTICHHHLPECARQCAVAVLLLLLLTACSTVDQTAADIFASRAAAGAVYSGRLLQGQVIFSAPRQASIHLQGSATPALSCFGALHFTASTSGIANLSCNDGSAVVVPFQALGPLRGSGRSQGGQPAFSLAYGLPPEMLATYLGVASEQLKPPSP